MTQNETPEFRLRAGFRLARVVCHILFGMALSAFFPLLKQEVRQRIVKYWSRNLLEVLNVGLEVRGNAHPVNRQAQLLVANHISWVDVIAMSAVAPACFVAKSEVGDWPILGGLCKRVGTLFVKRDTRRDAMRVSREVAGMLSQGISVALFPEGTSSDGLLPGHFHSSLLQGAIDVGGELCPVAIRYHDADGNTSRDAAFIGDMSFMQSLWKILRSPSLRVSVHYLPPISCGEKSRRALAAEAQGAIHMALARFSPDHSVCAADTVLMCDMVEGMPVLQ